MYLKPLTGSMVTWEGASTVVPPLLSLTHQAHLFTGQYQKHKVGCPSPPTAENSLSFKNDPTEFKSLAKYFLFPSSQVQLVQA